MLEMLNITKELVTGSIDIFKSLCELLKSLELTDISDFLECLGELSEDERNVYMVKWGLDSPVYEKRTFKDIDRAFDNTLDSRMLYKSAEKKVKEKARAIRTSKVAI